MDWWVVKQLRAMVLSDLQTFVPAGYFENCDQNLTLNDGFENSKYLSAELRWGYLAGRLGLRLVYEPTSFMSARQVSASELLIHLGMLACSQSQETAATQLSLQRSANGATDENMVAASEQLRSNITTCLNNVHGALKQYFHYLTPFEAAPFVSLLASEPEILSRANQRLPDEAITHYNHLCQAAFADGWKDLARAQKAFLNDESANGRGIGGAGFAARLAKLYAEDLTKRSKIIVTNLKQVHSDFGAPLALDVEVQLQDMGTSTLSDAYQGLEGAYSRYLQGLGLSDIYPSGLDQQYHPHHAGVKNQIGRHLWTLRNVPMKSTKEPLGQPTFIFNAPVGAVQTGSNATAHVQQQWTLGNFAELTEALERLGAAIEIAPELNAEEKRVLVADIDKANTELISTSPIKSNLTEWLGGLAAMTQTIASVQPAVEAVLSAAKALGIPL
jgi:hypothetical protein